LITACGLIAVVSLGIAVQAARYAHSASSRGSLRAELAQAESMAIAQRWERAPLGQIFPGSVGYLTAQDTAETASRLGIGAGDDCAAALDSTLQGAAAEYGCVAALRASYVDELQGTVYTVGVIVFPNDRDALGFYNSVPQGAGPAGIGLNTLALPGTATQLFTDSARQTLDSWVTGTYVVLSVSGYADGRPAIMFDEANDAIFAPGRQIVKAVATVLAARVPVHCGNGEFVC
jgi:hypothetical protein